MKYFIIEDFKELESTWRGVLFLVQNTEFSKPVKFELLDVTKEELYEDLNEASNGEGYEKDSGFWHHVYWGAYDKVGGHSYTAIIGDLPNGKHCAGYKFITAFISSFRISTDSIYWKCRS